MSERKRLLILANSKKAGGRCIAGRELTWRDDAWHLGGWVRPVSDYGQGELVGGETLCRDGTPVGVLGIAEVELLNRPPNPYQPENWRIAGRHPWLSWEPAPARPRPAVLDERLPHLWMQPRPQTDRVSHAFLTRSPFGRSLAVIRPEQFRVRVCTEEAEGQTRTRFRALFSYRDSDFVLGFTDPVVCARFASVAKDSGQPGLTAALACGDNLLICVSLTADHEGEHYKVVATAFEGM